MKGIPSKDLDRGFPENEGSRKWEGSLRGATPSRNSKVTEEGCPALRPASQVIPGALLKLCVLQAYKTHSLYI